MIDNNWYERIKQAVKENIPVLVTIGATAATIVAIVQTRESSNSLERNNQLLKVIEEKITSAIEAPTIVKVEIGDDIELYGTGNRVD